MLKKLIPVLLILVFSGAGIAAGLMLKPDPDVKLADHDPCGEDPNAEAENAEEKEASKPENVSFEYVKLSNQFIVPVIKGDLVKSVAVVALSLEVAEGAKDKVYAVEPKVRDVFLQALFDHASLGGFDGAFATTENLLRMRRSLKEAGTAVLGDILNDVLVTDIARQDN
ncbi:flagellar basal body-associated FliL family protein [Planktotalea sp.]|uniref:flagellar basal body-associated FliL family protein n=1 Tax=Planktotalea sp. TaxID=2029877 RepID=UPI003D6BF0B4